MESNSLEPDTHQFFEMKDFESEPPRLLIELNYLKAMFDLDVKNNREAPIVITLRETQKHFKDRYK